MSDLETVLADLAEHPNSTAHEIGERVGMKSRRVWHLLDHAAYDGKCQRWHDGTSGSAWKWEIPPDALDHVPTP
jgi:hypothetical protein